MPVLQQMENMYNQLKIEINEAQSELNTRSAIAESFFPPTASLATPRQRRSIEEDERKPCSYTIYFLTNPICPSGAGPRPIPYVDPFIMNSIINFR